jgi:nicotinate-nucleotide pyrophosphorylase (carboxylating)
MGFMQLDLNEINHLIGLALAEDVPENKGFCDVTSEAVIADGSTSKAYFRSREAIVFVGKVILEQVFVRASNVRLKIFVDDGQFIGEKTIIAEVEGDTKEILKLERTALNFIQYLSAIATQTREYVEKVKHTNAQILDTRKTLPAYRHLAKYAVKCGGGVNHRIGLYDAVLIKDNHIAASGSVAEAVKKAKAYAPELKVQVECDTLHQLTEALEAGAEFILLDNMKPEALKNAVHINEGRAVLEASGGVNLSTVKEIAETGVDFISIGALTHSVKAVDIGLDFD